jgi:exodeoxyribonuclease X
VTDQYVNLIAIDFESTGKDALTALPIEYGYAAVDDAGFWGGGFIALPLGEKIPPETSAVHHLVDEDLEGAPEWSSAISLLEQTLLVDGGLHDLVLVAHNAEYEQTILRDTVFKPGLVQWICTYKLALVLWPDAPSHSNEALRYWLKLGSNRGRQHGQGSHSALHDARVTAALANVAIETLMVTMGVSRGAAIHAAVQISHDRAKLPTCPIGKFRGVKWEDVESGFMHWCLKQSDMRSDVVECCKAELDRRGSLRV